MSSKTTLTVGCTMQPDQYLPFLAGCVIEAVGTHASVAGLERLREARVKLDRLIRTLEQLEQEQKEVHDRDLRNIQAQQQHDNVVFRRAADKFNDFSRFTHIPRYHQQQSRHRRQRQIQPSGLCHI